MCAIAFSDNETGTRKVEHGTKVQRTNRKGLYDPFNYISWFSNTGIVGVGQQLSYF